MSDFMLPALYLRQIGEILDAMGKSSDIWLQRCGVDAQQLDAADFHPSYELFCRLVEEALQVSAEPALGLLLGERLLVNSHGILGFAALQSATLRQAIELLERYLGLRTSLVRLTHITDVALHQEQIQLVPCYPLGSIQTSVFEAVMLSIKNVLDAATQGAVRAERVSFPCAAPRYAPLAAEIFGCPVAYAQPWAGFTFSSAQLDQPLRMADPEALKQAELICQRELSKHRETAAVSSRVRRLLLERQQNFPSLNAIARLLLLTPRTLHRHLREEGTSYKQILQEVRHTLALEQLKAGRLSVEQIAYSLGYNDVANFRRAFKRWEGVPPSCFKGDV